MDLLEVDAERRAVRPGAGGVGRGGVGPVADRLAGRQHDVGEEREARPIEHLGRQLEVVAGVEREIADAAPPVVDTRLDPVRLEVREHQADLRPAREAKRGRQILFQILFGRPESMTRRSCRRRQTNRSRCGRASAGRPRSPPGAPNAPGSPARRRYSRLAPPPEWRAPARPPGSRPRPGASRYGTSTVGWAESSIAPASLLPPSVARPIAVLSSQLPAMKKSSGVAT